MCAEVAHVRGLKAGTPYPYARNGLVVQSSLPVCYLYSHFTEFTYTVLQLSEPHMVRRL